MKKLKTLNQYKKERDSQKKWFGWTKSGVACPKCESELMWPILKGMDSEKDIFICPNCGFEIEE